MSVSVSISQEETAELAVSVLIGVARLGEADLANWWSSRGLDPDVRFALSGFPNTSKYLGAELAVLSAKRRHEQLLRRDTALHLFSPLLPFLGWTNAYLAERKTEPRLDFVDQLLVSGVDDVRAQLRGWVTAIGVDAHGGLPISAADLRDLGVATQIMVLLAGQYLELEGEFTPPFMDLVR